MKNKKLLGLFWNSSNGNLSFCFQPASSEIQLTKRVILSLIAKCYDPLGLLSPIIVNCKLFMQILWQEKLEWDELIPDYLAKQWEFIYDQLIKIKFLSIPRWIGYLSHSKLEIHGFGDASEQAICANIYFRILNESSCTVNIIAAKTKVNPIKTLSIPRLELCASLLLCKLLSSILEALSLHKYPIHLWSDSKNTLAWISSSPHLWQPFISHRIAEI